MMSLWMFLLLVSATRTAAVPMPGSDDEYSELPECIYNIAAQPNFDDYQAKPLYEGPYVKTPKETVIKFQHFRTINLTFSTIPFGPNDMIHPPSIPNVITINPLSPKWDSKPGGKLPSAFLPGDKSVHRFALRSFSFACALAAGGLEPAKCELELTGRKKEVWKRDELMWITYDPDKERASDGWAQFKHVDMSGVDFFDLEAVEVTIHGENLLGRNEIVMFDNLDVLGCVLDPVELEEKERKEWEALEKWKKDKKAAWEKSEKERKEREKNEEKEEEERREEEDKERIRAERAQAKKEKEERKKKEKEEKEQKKREEKERKEREKKEKEEREKKEREERKKKDEEKKKMDEWGRCIFGDAPEVIQEPHQI